MVWAYPRRAVEAIGRRVADRFWRALPGADRTVFELRPFHLQLELTNLCNADCVFCTYSQQTRPHVQMNEDVFRKAVADYLAMGGGSVNLTPTVGDPLIHPRFVEWVQYLRSMESIDRITVTTNGILLGRHGIDKILDCGLSRINISVAGFDEDMYRRVYRSSAYKKVRANVAELLEKNSQRKQPIPIVLCFRADRPAADVFADPDLQPLLAFNPGVEFLEVFSRSGGLLNDLPEGLHLAPAASVPKRLACRRTYLALVVQSNGDVQACGCESSVNAPDLIIGNIEQASLQEIWRGDRMRALRASFGQGSLNSNCASCDYYYGPPNFHTTEMRSFAKVTRRRLAGQPVRHDSPLSGVWTIE